MIDSLLSVPLFAQMTRGDVKAVAEISHEVFHEAGRTVVAEGEEGGAFHLIIEGEADVIVAGSVVRRIGPGDYFGEISLIDGGPRTASVVTVTPLMSLAIPGPRFRALIDTRPELARALLLGLCRAIRADG
jgi:CRP-like cAMP-binding protein